MPSITAFNNFVQSTGQKLKTGPDEILNDAVTASKLRDDPSVDANRAVTTDHIRDASVTQAKLATDIAEARTPTGWEPVEHTPKAKATAAARAAWGF